ncbi:hypothetical protein BDW62DRAFT_215963 [Aspergillus aurantiobrunneus]
MPQVVVVVGAGFYGLIAAKTYLQVTGAYSRSEKSEFEDDLLIIDAATDIGGTWARERLYPNLLSQNSYSHYEFSDLPLATAVPGNSSEQDDHSFIPGWKINRYVHVWCQKWDLTRRIRLNWKVTRVARLPSKEWTLDIITQTGLSSTAITVMCNKLILATGLTSEPNVPDIPQTGDRPVPAVHARDLGKYCCERVGYRPIPQPRELIKASVQSVSIPRAVAVYGGAKSAFDVVHLFGSLHRNSASFNLEAHPVEPVQVHWIIGEAGHGPAWMTRPTTQLGTRQIPSDQAVCTRIVGMMSQCVYEIPKRMTWPPQSSIPRLEGSWLRRLIHENSLGRAVIGRMWKQVDASIHEFAKYDSQPKMAKLRPAASVIDCTSPGRIANHLDLWDAIRGPNVHIYRSSIARISTTSPDTSLDLADGGHIPAVDLIVHATGYKRSVSIPFDPPALGAHLGLPSLSVSKPDHDWEAVEHKVESRMRSIFDPSRLFRRLASPSLIAEGDRSFAVVVQALWVAAFLTGGLDDDVYNGPLASSDRIYESVAEDVVWGRLTGAGLNVDTLQYNDALMRDLGLNPYREEGRWWKELRAVYGPSSYAGIVEEWMERRGMQ